MTEEIKTPQTPLCELAQKYGTDKVPWVNDKVWGHSYTPVYYEKFKDIRNSVKKVLEIGIGTQKSMPRKLRKVSNYKTGASLFMWRDFFPNAEIYGIDILPECMVEGEDRIHTYLIDQADKTQLKNLLEIIGTDIDIVIDDGSHWAVHQVFTCMILKELLPKDVIYVIEDIKEMAIWKVLEETGFDVEYKMFRHKHGFDDRLFWITSSKKKK